MRQRRGSLKCTKAERNGLTEETYVVIAYSKEPFSYKHYNKYKQNKIFPKQLGIINNTNENCMARMIRPLYLTGCKNQSCGTSLLVHPNANILVVGSNPI